MKLKRFNLLIKFMEMTFSENDGEALAALRMANKELAAEGITWERVFKRLVTLDVEEAPPETPVRAPQARTGQTQADRIDEMFDMVYDRTLSDSSREFIDSLHDQWKRKRSLSPNQFDALEKYTQPRGSR